MGVSEDPRNLVERAAAAAMDAVDAVLEPAGASVGTLYVSLHALGMPAGEELDSVAAAHGADLADDPAERARDVVAFLVTEAVAVGRQIGLDVKVVPLRGGPSS